MKSKKALYIFLVGLAIVGICIKVKTGISAAFSKTENGGLSGFVVYRINERLSGERFSFDILFNPIGYLFMMIGVKQLESQLRRAKKLLAASALAMIMSIVYAILPLYVGDGLLLIKLMVSLYILEGLALLYIITGFTAEIKDKVDPYYNMDVGKDLVFATELFFFGYFAMVIAVFVNAMNETLSLVLLAFDWTVMIYSVLYLIYKINKHNNQLKIFE